MLSIPKPLIYALLALAVVTAITVLVKGYGNARYEAGQEATAQKYREIVAKKDRENRAIEAKLAKALTDREEKRIERQEARVRTETVIQERLVKELLTQPLDCTVSDEFLEDRNAIRRLGP